MAVALIIGLAGAVFCGVLYAVIRGAVAKDRAEQKALRDANNLRIERERVQKDEEIRELPEDELTKRLGRWSSGVQPPD